MSDNTFDTMRAVLVPKGTAPLVRLELRSNSYFDHAYVTECIDDAVKLAKDIAIGDMIGDTRKLTALERLALRVLVDSAGIA